MTLRVIAHITAKPDKVEQAKALCLGFVAPTRKEAGCIKYDLLTDLADPLRFTFEEEWENEAALDRHLQAPHVASVLDQIPLLFEGPPDIRRYRQIA